MKCPYCPKEISQEKEHTRLIGKKYFISNPDYDKHMKIHMKPIKKK